jgi:hypothetical protein
MEYFKEWRAADHAAIAAEKRIYAASLLLIDGRGPGPSDEEVAEAHRLREIANDLFHVAMREIGDISNALRH